MKFLLDTNVVSELRKGPRADRKVTAWFQGLDPDELFTDVLTKGLSTLHPSRSKV